ncbi:hypothetical protein N1851_000293 [Merluccius polli]|uniref:Uncharacterized protein n=1 Tax=Merluccius polli TaxID=89951 RepID=A0AA47NE67_MERPO|nr:hypothetical protein N1851_000293 [Merluccius polli]
MDSQLEDDVQKDLGSLEKAPLENVSKLLTSRKYKLCQVTRRMNIVNKLMKDITNVEEVTESMTKYGQLVEEFNNTHKAYQLLLSKEERKLDTEKWYMLKVGDMTAFMASVTKWKNVISQGEIDHDNIGLNVDNVAPKDSISAVLSRRSSRSATSSTSSARIRAEAENAAIQTRIQALKQKHALEEKEEELNMHGHTPTPPSPSVPETGGLGLLLQLAEVSLGVAGCRGWLDGFWRRPDSWAAEVALGGPGTVFASPPSTRATRHDPSHLLLEHGALGSWSPGRGAAGLGCSRLDPGEASDRRLPVAVAALPPRSSAGRRCRSGGAGAGVAVFAAAGGSSAAWTALPCPVLVGGAPRWAPVWQGSPATRHLSGFLSGPSDTGHG